MNPQLTLPLWRRSVISLAFQIACLSQSSNLLGDACTERGEYFFSDNGVPRPRPATALAWASLCAFGPVNGFVKPGDEFWEDERQIWSPTQGHFLLPFLPKILYNEEQNQSLARMSKHHERDSADRIRWGSVFVADSSSGQIIEQMSHGQRVAKEWIDSHPRGYILPTWEGQSHIPALFGETGEGWQFGIIQNQANLLVTLRDPFIELARRGIIETKHGGSDCPRIKRLIFRFLDITAARAWAFDYSESMRCAFESDVIGADIQLLMTQIEEKQRAEHLKATAKATSNSATTKTGQRIKMPDNFIGDFLKSLGGSDETN